MDNILSVETLNVHNVDNFGNIVLNDEKLLGLIQLYPFLYNRRVRPFQDSDYDEWAWNRITDTFNQLYDGLVPKVAYTPEQLQKRWVILQPIIKKMSKMFDLSVVPETLRGSIVRLSVLLDDPTPDARPISFSQPQKIIFENIPMVERLPLKYRLQLESEMMDILLNSELNAKGTVKLTPADQQRIEKDYEEFLRCVQLKELFVLKSLSPENVEGNITEENDITNCENLTESVFDYHAPEEITDRIDLEGSISPIEVEEDLIGFESITDVAEEKRTPFVYVPRKNAMASTRTPIRRFVPLSEAKKYVRRCYVRLNRCNLEDYIPLALIKERKLKDHKKYY